jgi:hypothetical protein
MVGSVFTDPGSQICFPSLPLDIAEQSGRSSYQQFGHLNSELYCSELGRLYKYMTWGGERCCEVGVWNWAQFEIQM